MSGSLSSGSLVRICQGEEIREPVLQLLDCQVMQGMELER